MLAEVVVIKDGSPRGAARGAVFSHPGAIGVGIDLLVRDRFSLDPVEESGEGRRGAIDSGVNGGSVRR